MPYADKAALKAAYREWLAEDNPDVLSDGEMDNAIGFVENDLDWGVWGPSKTFRVLDMQAVVTSEIAADDEEYVSLPDDFITKRYVVVTTQSKKQTLDYRDPIDFVNEADSLSTSRRIYTVSAGQIRVKPVLQTGDMLEMGYYQQIPALALDTDTNWLLSKNPQIYFYGGLSHLMTNDALGNPRKLQNATTGYQRAVLGAIDADERRESGEGPIAWGQHKEPA